MTETKQIDPAVSLEFDDGGGLQITVSAQLRPGVRNWTPEEAGHWFSRIWQRAETVHAALLAHRLLAAGEGAQIVGLGEVAWWVSGEASEITLAFPKISSLPLGSDSLSIAAEEPGKEGVTQEVSPPRIPERLAESADQKTIIRYLNRAGRGMSVAELKRETKLSEYRIKKALAELMDKAVIQEERVETGGRWKEMAIFSGAAPGAVS